MLTSKNVEQNKSRSSKHFVISSLTKYKSSYRIHTAPSHVPCRLAWNDPYGDRYIDTTINIISLQHRVRATKAHIQNRTNLFTGTMW